MASKLQSDMTAGPGGNARGAVLFVGDFNVDLIFGGLSSLPVVDREVTCSSYRTTLGSAAIIAACAYASLGGNAEVAGLAGEDAYGEYIFSELKRHGVGTSLVGRTAAAATGVTANLIHGSTRTQVTYPGTISLFDGKLLTPAAIAGFAHLHFSGIYQQTMLRPQLLAIIETAKRSGATVSLDPQWDQRERWELMDELLAVIDLLFVNEDEAFSISRCRTAEEALAALAGRTKAVCVKRGKLGVLAAADGEFWNVPAPAVEVVDTTGAGDCFDAGFLYAQIGETASPGEACRLGVMTGSASCGFAGGVAEPGELGASVAGLRRSSKRRGQAGTEELWK